GPEGVARDLGPGDRRCRPERREVLPQQARPRAARADTVDAEGSTGDHRQGERGPQDLTAPLAERAVDVDHEGPLRRRVAPRDLPDPRQVARGAAGSWTSSRITWACTAASSHAVTAGAQVPVARAAASAS